MLSDYGVENVGTRIADKVYFLLNGHEVIIPALQFIQSWSGFILLAETTPNSGEPDYREHRKKELFDLVNLIGIYPSMNSFRSVIY